jgi:hypothetical protein
LDALVTPVTAALSLLLLFSSLLLLFATAIPSSKRREGEDMRRVEVLKHVS